jgi:hypothetical protein
MISIDFSDKTYRYENNLLLCVGNLKSLERISQFWKYFVFKLVQIVIYYIKLNLIIFLVISEKGHYVMTSDN